MQLTISIDEANRLFFEYSMKGDSKRAQIYRDYIRAYYGLGK